MRTYEVETGFTTFLKTLGLLSLAVVLATASGCGDDDAEPESDEGDPSAEAGEADGGKKEGGGKGETVPVAKAGTPEAAVYASLDDAVARLEKADVYGFFEYHARVVDLARIRRKEGGMDEAVKELTSNPGELNMLLDIFKRARKGTIEFDESGSVATIVLPVPEVKVEPEPPANIIKEPVLTKAELRGYGSNIGEVIGKALDALA